MKIWNGDELAYDDARPDEMRFASATLSVKGTQDEPDGLRVRGIASLPTPDLLKDELDPMGAEFTLPMPFLWQHKRGEVIGRVELAKPTKDGIPFEAWLPYIKEDGRLKERVDEAIHGIKYGLLRDVSVGFKEIPDAIERLKSGGLRFKRWLWKELSLVDIGMHPGARITYARAAELSTPAVAGSTDARRRGPVGVIHLNTQDQMQALHGSLSSKAARMTEILSKAAEEGRATETAEREEYDRLALESKALNDDLARYAQLEEINIRAATPLSLGRTPAEPDTNGSALRDPFAGRIQVRRNLEKGATFTRYAMALLAAKGNLPMALEIAKGRFSDTPEVVDVLKAAVAAGTTTDADWAAPLVQYQNMAGEFAELLRPRTIFGRIEGFRRVPFNIRVPRQTGAGTYGWVGQAKPKPVGELAFDSITMDFAKIAGIIVLTDELARFSSPDAEATVRNDMLKGVAQFLDEQFIDPSVAAVSNVSPASITNGAPTVAATGTDAAALLADVNSLFSQLAPDLETAGGYWITNDAAVRSVSFMRNPLGQAEFGTVNPAGGTFLGYPVIVSNSVPHDSSGGLLIFVVPSEILVAEDAIVIDASREASVEMNTTPTSPVAAATVLVSLWQHNMIGLKVEKFVNYARRRDDVVGYITGALYGTGGS